MSTDRVERQVLLKAPLERVWAAISDSSEFGKWFGVAFDGPFVAGASLGAMIVPTTVDAEVAAAQETYRGVRFEVFVVEIVPMRLFSYRWHPNASESMDENATFPPTLVTFELSEVSGGVLLMLTESGFDALPPGPRARAFEMNGHGWTAQMELIRKYLVRG